MFPLAPLSLIGRMVAGEFVSGLASAAFGAARTASNSQPTPQPTTSFSDFLDKTDVHGNGWLSERPPSGRAAMAGGGYLSAQQAAETAQARGATGPAAAAPPAEMLLAAQTGPSGTVIATGPDMPMVARIHETYAALRAQRYG